jgi:hypothetical protein
VAVEIPNVDLGSLYLGRELASFVAADLELTVCTTPDAIALVDALARAGSVKRGPADSVMGFLVGRRLQDDYSRSTWYARWKQLRDLGIALDDQAQQLVSVPVSRYVGQLVDQWAVAA